MAEATLRLDPNTLRTQPKVNDEWKNFQKEVIDQIIENRNATSNECVHLTGYANVTEVKKFIYVHTFDSMTTNCYTYAPHKYFLPQIVSDFKHTYQSHSWFVGNFSAKLNQTNINATSFIGDNGNFDRAGFLIAQASEANSICNEFQSNQTTKNDFELAHDLLDTFFCSEAPKGLHICNIYSNSSSLGIYDTLANNIAGTNEVCGHVKAILDELQTH